MSRIGKMPISVPAGVDVTVNGNVVTVKGPKGTLTREFAHAMCIEYKDGVITVTRPNDLKINKSLHGLTRTLIHNMVEGRSRIHILNFITTAKTDEEAKELLEMLGAPFAK